MSFPVLPDRKPTFSFKWEKYGNRPILPMWVADTEFACAPAIQDALHKRVDHGILGYTLPTQYTPATDAIVSWCERRYGWSIDPSWLVWVPGVVPAFNLACQAFAKPNSRVIIQQPNYPPLLAAPELNHCEKVLVETIEENGRWTLDFDQLEKEAAHPDSHLMILCNPMNPVGSVMTEDELNRVAHICEAHNVVLCSDEIHCDLILNPQAKHLPASAHPVLENRSITLMAASKTFNIAGLGTAFAIIPDPKLRRAFNSAATGVTPWVTILGLVATEAAFTLCDEWYEQQLAYLRENQKLLVSKVNAIDGLSTFAADATFLAWIDASGLQVDNAQAWCEERGVGPSPGADFGWSHFFRLNFGCGRDMLCEVLSRLA